MVSPNPKPSAKKGPIPIPAWDKQTAYALQCLQTGTANKGQQQECLKWIIEEACRTYDNPFLMPGGFDIDWVPSFMAGRAFAGEQIVKLLNAKLSLFKDEAGE